MQASYKGFSTFADVEDEQLRTFNRARVMVNMAQDHSKKGRINAVGSMLILGYFGQMPFEEREVIKAEFAKQMNNNGFQLKV